MSAHPSSELIHLQPLVGCQLDDPEVVRLECGAVLANDIDFAVLNVDHVLVFRRRNRVSPLAEVFHHGVAAADGIPPRSRPAPPSHVRDRPRRLPWSGYTSSLSLLTIGHSQRFLPTQSSLPTGRTPATAFSSPFRRRDKTLLPCLETNGARRMLLTAAPTVVYLSIITTANKK